MSILLHGAQASCRLRHVELEKRQPIILSSHYAAFENVEQARRTKKHSWQI